jgi:hypothetical protein
MTESADNKIKATSQIEVAKTLIKESERLLGENVAALPAAKKALEDYEGGLESQELQDAATAYEDAVKGFEVPK